MKKAESFKMIVPVFICLAVIVSAFPVFAQDEPRSPGQPVAANVNVDTAQQSLKEVSVTKFEDPAFFYTGMSRDAGLITTRRLAGSPIDKEPIPDEELIGIDEEDKYVLGVRVNFERRGVHSFAVLPVRPIPIPGITKTLSVWVAGRNNNHVLSMVIHDYWGNPKILTLGKLNFSGWKKMTVAVPPGIVQRDYHFSAKSGIKFAGLRVDCAIDETYGVYYIYFDDLRAVTDLFSEETRDIDDMVDGW